MPNFLQAYLNCMGVEAIGYVVTHSTVCVFTVTM